MRTVTASIDERRFFMDNNLTGFDMVWAITQNTINSQLQWLASLPNALPVTESIGSLADPEQITIGLGDVVKGRFTLPLKIGSPLVDFNTSRPKLVNFKIPIKAGQAAFLETDLDTMTLKVKTVDIAGAILGFEVDVNIAKRATDALRNNLPIPPEILDQLEQFKAEDFEIASIFLDFENSRLMTYDATLSSFPPTLAPGFAEATNVAMGKFLAKKSVSDNPFFLGHAAVRKTAPPADEILAPTGTNFSTTPFIRHDGQPTNEELGLSTFNFLLVGGDHDILKDSRLSGPGAGVFNDNFVPSNEYDGVGVIDLHFFTAKYLQPFFIDPLGQRIPQAFGDFHSVHPEADNPAIEDTKVLVPNEDGVSWRYHQKVDLEWSSGGISPHKRWATRELTFDVQLMNKPDPSAGGALRLALEIRGNLYRYEKDEIQTAAHQYSGDAWAWARFLSKHTIYFTAGKEGQVTLRAEMDPIADPTTDHGDGGIYVFADFFNRFLGLHQISSEWSDIALGLAGEELTGSVALLEASKDMLKEVATRVVLPAPHVFLYRDLVLNPQNDPEIRLTYKTQAA
jgi:hypothetical protein